MIALPVMIESTGAAMVLVPNGAKPLHPKPSTNALTHMPLNATDAPMYTPLSLVEDGGTMEPKVSLSLLAMAAPVAMSKAADAVPTILMAMLTTLLC